MISYNHQPLSLDRRQSRVSHSYESVLYMSMHTTEIPLCLLLSAMVLNI